MVEILWVGRTTDRKTGPIPMGYIGGSREESLATCRGCPLLRKRDGGSHVPGDPLCNAQYGTLGLGHTAMIRGMREHPSRDRSLERALGDRWAGAHYVRFPALGDPARISLAVLRRVLRQIRDSGLAILGYTHFWREVGKSSAKGRLLRRYFMASCGSLQEADEAIADGWLPTVIMPYTQPAGVIKTPAGHPAVLCPAQTPKGKVAKVTCNACGLCARQQNPGLVILFRDRSPTVLAKARRMR